MKIVWLILLTVFAACSRDQPAPTRAIPTNSRTPATDYEQKLAATKAHYRFTQQSWRSSSRFTAIFDTLVTELTATGENAPDAQKFATFRRAVTALNELHRKDPSLIETSEAEHLCELLAKVALAAGMPPSKFPTEEGAADGRDW